MGKDNFKNTTLDDLAGMVAKGFGGVEVEISDIKTEISDIKTEISDIKTEISDVKTEMEEGFDEVKTELHEIHGIVASQRNDIDRFATRIKKLEEAVFSNT